MNVNLILPKDLVPIGPDDKVFFLVGPIRGGANWQEEAINLLSEKVPTSFVACPRSYPPDHPFNKTALIGDGERFPDNNSWERHYRAIARRQGAVICWLPKEDPEDPRDPKTGPYGRDTYGELGEERVYAEHDPHARVVFGGEPGFSGLRIIEKNGRATLGARFFLHLSLKETVDAAVALVNGKR